jgi:hypothetical protein
VSECRLDSRELGLGPFMGSCERGNEHLVE